MQVPLWKTGLGLWLTLCVSLLAGGLEQTKVVQNTEASAHIKNVFLNIRGDARATHRMWTYLDFELEDRSFTVVDSEHDADAVVDMEIKSQTDVEDLSVGMVHLRFHANGKDTQEETCASLGHGTSVELFDNSPEAIALDLKERFPDAHTVKLDSASDIAASKLFHAKFEEALKTAKLALIADGSADVLVDVKLAVAEVAIEEQTLHYELHAVTHEKQLFSETGTLILSVRLKGHAPEPCPERFDDLEWVATAGDPIVNVALSVAKDLVRSNSTKPARQNH